MALVAMSMSPPPVSALMDVDRDLQVGRTTITTTSTTAVTTTSGTGGHSSRMYAPHYASPPTSPSKSEPEPPAPSGMERGPESDPTSIASDVANAASSSPAISSSASSPAQEHSLSSSSSSASLPSDLMDVISSSPFAAAAEVLKRADAQDSVAAGGSGSGSGGSGLRRAKDLAAFTSLLPPAVEFVEGSSRGVLASLEGRYEPINVPPKPEEEKEEGEKREGEQNRRGRSASVNGKLVNGNDKVRPASPTSPKRASRRDSTSEGQTQKSLYTDPIDLTWPSVSRPVGSGLINLGNTCFLNSALQCLLHTPPLLSVLYSHIKGKCRVKTGFCASCAMHQIADDAFTKGRAFVPFAITKNLNAIAKHLRKGRQEDSHEFLRYLVDAMQKSCISNYPFKIDHKLASTTWVHKIFGGRLRSRVTCQQCGYNSDTYDNILDLSIDIYNCDRLRDALKKFTAVDVLKGADKYKCEKCKRPVNAEKRFTIHDAPTVLTVHLKRFTPMGRKLQHPIRYDDRLSLSPFMSDGQFGPSYALYGVISHAGGGPNSGHYYAHVRAANGQWYEMNDDAVERRNGALNMKNAYVLFYIREKGQALEAALGTGTGVGGVVKATAVNGNGSEGKKRKEVPGGDDSEGGSASQSQTRYRVPGAWKKVNGIKSSEDKDTEMGTLDSEKGDVQSAGTEDAPGKRRTTAMKENSLKAVTTTTTGKPYSLFAYGASDSEDEETGEPIDRAQLNGRTGKKSPEADDDGDDGEDKRKDASTAPNPSSPIRPPPTSSPPLPTPRRMSPMEVIPATNFYNSKSPAAVVANALKRKSSSRDGPGDEDDDGDEEDGKGSESGLNFPIGKTQPRRQTYSGPGLPTSTSTSSSSLSNRSLTGASPFARSRFGTNLSASRGDDNNGSGSGGNVFLRKQRSGKRTTYGGRRRFMM